MISESEKVRTVLQKLYFSYVRIRFPSVCGPVLDKIYSYLWNLLHADNSLIRGVGCCILSLGSLTSCILKVKNGGENCVYLPEAKLSSRRFCLQKEKSRNL